MTYAEFNNIIKERFPEVTEAQMEQFRLMEGLYREWNAKINVVSRKDIDELYRHHVLHSLAIAAYIKANQGNLFFDEATDPALQKIRAKVEFAKERVALAEARLKAKVEQYQKEQL